MQRSYPQPKATAWASVQRDGTSPLLSLLGDMGYAFSKGVAQLSSTLLPGRCVICSDAAHAALCDLCTATFWHAEIAIQRCGRCGIRMPRPTEGFRSEHALTCGHCRSQPPAFDCTLALADYRPPLDVLAILLKFRGRHTIAQDLAQRLAERLITHMMSAMESRIGTSGHLARRGADHADYHVTDCIPNQVNHRGNDRGNHQINDHANSDAPVDQADLRPQLLIPAPLSTKRLTLRGYNQAWEITRRVGAAVGIAAHPGMVSRQHTAAQSGLSLSARQRGLSRAFFVPDQVRSRLTGMHVGVIDDVMTTGATFEAIAQCLKNAGARRVTNLVVFRTA